MTSLKNSDNDIKLSVVKKFKADVTQDAKSTSSLMSDEEYWLQLTSKVTKHILSLDHSIEKSRVKLLINEVISSFARDVLVDVDIQLCDDAHAMVEYMSNPISDKLLTSVVGVLYDTIPSVDVSPSVSKKSRLGGCCSRPAHAPVSGTRPVRRP